jgi:hypothetical protein
MDLTKDEIREFISTYSNGELLGTHDILVGNIDNNKDHQDNLHLEVVKEEIKKRNIKWI